MEVEAARLRVRAEGLLTPLTAPLPPTSATRGSFGEGRGSWSFGEGRRSWAAESAEDLPRYCEREEEGAEAEKEGWRSELRGRMRATDQRIARDLRQSGIY